MKLIPHLILILLVSTLAAYANETRDTMDQEITQWPAPEANTPTVVAPALPQLVAIPQDPPTLNEIRQERLLRLESLAAEARSTDSVTLRQSLEAEMVELKRAGEREDLCILLADAEESGYLERARELRLVLQDFDKERVAVLPVSMIERDAVTGKPLDADTGGER